MLSFLVRALMFGLIIFAVIVLFGGCASVPGDPAKLNAEQLREIAKDKSASVACTIVNSPWGVGRTIWVQVDKSTFKAGAVTVGADCTVTVESDSSR